ncbi:outer membrane insertion C-terminal signal [Sinomicrobium oceani]|uniref:Outer membrane insertion C-terminal signal n=2 Tax=Sinomicrobium oceani TaxID=1150368 RepID=A0A1K1R601_9FLAO|nr:outer membrane insertion C-terminal signal [Sinomicrobium oceani]
MIENIPYIRRINHKSIKMKKLVLLAVMAFGFVCSSSAQDVTFGIKGGLNFSTVKFDSDMGGASPDGKTGFYIGGLADFGISEKFHIQPEAIFSFEGADDYDMTYLNIPVLAKFYVVEGFNIQAGPQFGFLLDSDEDSEFLKTMNFGLSFGAGYELPAGVFFDARYNLGLSDVLDVDVADAVGAELKTRGFMVGLGYRF